MKKIVQMSEPIKAERERVPIKNCTRLGYLLAEDGDGIDISSRMRYHRGTVQKGMSLTIKASCDVGVIEIGQKID